LVVVRRLPDARSVSSKEKRIANWSPPVQATDAERAAALRDRYLTLALQSLALHGAPELPGPAPDPGKGRDPVLDVYEFG
jgi:hypothetical protein